MKIVAAQGEESLWESVRERIGAPSFCGGKGLCGKCKVKVIEGRTSVSAADRKHLTQKEIEEGFRIACQSVPLTDCVIEAGMTDEEGMKILSVKADAKKAPFVRKDCYSVAIDVGTTTLAFALLDRTGTVIATKTGLNHQRSFGADVVSRIEFAMKGRGAELTACIRRDIRQGLSSLLRENGIGLPEVGHIAVAGNTAMEQLFFGLPVDGLGSYPFLPWTEDFLCTEYGTLFPELENWEKGAEKLKITGFPCIAGFVGGDITAGLYELISDPDQMAAVFLDIGTNGEIACIHNGRIYTASTAAGPVFEGGNISCGMAGLPGAICSVRSDGGVPECSTVENESPKGICGSGLTEAVAELLKLGVIDRTGRMMMHWQKTGYVLARGRDGNISLTQQDIREFQMAKAAIAAGTEILLKKAELEERLIREVFLAGGLGNGLSVKKAVYTGLLIKGAARYVRFAGNTSLKGAIKFLREESSETRADRVRRLLSRTEHVHLANTAEFEEAYIRHMNFPGRA